MFVFVNRQTGWVDGWVEGILTTHSFPDVYTAAAVEFFLDLHLFFITAADDMFIIYT